MKVRAAAWAAKGVLLLLSSSVLTPLYLLKISQGRHHHYPIFGHAHNVLEMLGVFVALTAMGLVAVALACFVLFLVGTTLTLITRVAFYLPHPKKIRHQWYDRCNWNTLEIVRPEKPTTLVRGRIGTK